MKVKLFVDLIFEIIAFIGHKIVTFDDDFINL